MTEHRADAITAQQHPPGAAAAAAATPPVISSTMSKRPPSRNVHNKKQHHHCRRPSTQQRQQQYRELHTDPALPSILSHPLLQQPNASVDMSTTYGSNDHCQESPPPPPRIVAEDDQYLFRVLHSSDMDDFIKLHSELFPVKYSRRFYQSLLTKKGHFTLLSLCKETGQMVGVCCTRAYKETEIRCFCSRTQFRVAYVMTLGVTEQHRRRKLASRMLDIVEREMARIYRCTRITLHCKHDNMEALLFYAKAGFWIARQISEYYKIDGQQEDAWYLVKDVGHHLASSMEWNGQQLPQQQKLHHIVTNIEQWYDEYPLSSGHTQCPIDGATKPSSDEASSSSLYGAPIMPSRPQYRVLSSLLRLDQKTPISHFPACREHPLLFLDEAAYGGMAGCCNKAFDFVDIVATATLRFLVQLFILVANWFQSLYFAVSSAKGDKPLADETETALSPSLSSEDLPHVDNSSSATSINKRRIKKFP